MNKGPEISTSRAVEIYLDALSCREYGNTQNIPRLIEDLFSGSSGWTITFYGSEQSDEYEPKAAVIAGFGRYTLVVDRTLWARAKNGDIFASFVLAHELGHIQLRHHDHGSIRKHYRLRATEAGLANIPPTVEELEANLWAVFFQCGDLLENPNLEAVQLAKASRTDVRYVKRAQRYLNVDSFKRLLVEHRNRKKPPREIL